MRKADNLPPSCAVVTKSRNLNFLESSGPLQACNGTALPFFLPVITYCNVCVHHRNNLLTSTLITVNVVADSLTHDRALTLSDKDHVTSCRLVRAEVSHSPDHVQGKRSGDEK